jgi:hypothetical protein
MWPLYLTKPNSRNLFMKKLTRDRAVPIISASVSWLIFAMTGSGLLRRSVALREMGKIKTTREENYFQNLIVSK